MNQLDTVFETKFRLLSCLGTVLMKIQLMLNFKSRFLPLAFFESTHHE